MSTRKSPVSLPILLLLALTACAQDAVVTGPASTADAVAPIDGAALDASTLTDADDAAVTDAGALDTPSPDAVPILDVPEDALPDVAVDVEGMDAPLDTVLDAESPDAAEPDAAADAEPDAAEPDAAEPDAAEPDAAEPDAAEPDAGEPDTGSVDGLEPVGDCTVDADCAVKGAAPACKTWQCISKQCFLGSAPAQTPCNDGNACSLGDQCDAGQCVGQPAACDDGNPCTTDTCDPATGKCGNANALLACDDGNACTEGDACQDGKCAAGGAKSCDDANPCTDDTCAPASGCSHLGNTAPCTPADACLGAGVCLGGKCAGGKAMDCDDANPCTADACAAGQCAHTAAAGFCDDANPCTEADVCAAGKCAAGAPLACDDQNACTMDSCDLKDGSCGHAPAAGACDDGDACTGEGKCAGTVCAPGSAIVCEDNNPCTDNGCAKLTGCVYTNNSAPCSDAAKCLLGTCGAGSCSAGTSTGCNDNNPCTKDECGGSVGCQASPIADGPYQGKGDACTSATFMCKNGVYSPIKTDCGDGNPCTNDACDPVTGCQWTPNTAPCDDGDACTAGDACANGKCATGKPIDVKTVCNDGNACTDEGCVAKTGCSHSNNTAACDDGSVCTKNEACAAGKCVGGKLSDCDDGKQCTNDLCDAVTGNCSWTGKTGACEDGNGCTQGDVCQAATCVPGVPITCDDANSCTTDACDGKTGACSFTVKAGGGVPACDGAVVGGRCMKAFQAASTRTAAEQACVVWGGHLTRVGSAQENASVRLLATQGCGGAVPAWIGLNDLAVEGKYEWPDGGAFGYSNWNPGEPNNCDACCGAPEDVVQMIDNGHWNDICSNQVMTCYVCQRPMPALGCDDASVCSSADTCVAGKCTGAVLNCDDAKPCTADSCDAKLGCVHANAADGTACGAGFACTAGTCALGSDSNPATSCVQLLAAGAKDGLYWLDPDGKSGPVPALQTLCDMVHDGGGWALVAIAANDNQNSWTWNARLLWSSNQAVFGSAATPLKDFKSAGLHVLAFKDVLAVHAPSGVYAAYHAVGDGSKSLAQKIDAYGGLVCWQPGQGYPMSAGTLATANGGKLCNTSLYFNAADHDGNAQCGDNDQTFGPNWNTNANSPCPFDDPGLSGSMGPLFSEAGVEQLATGFGAALGLNKGTAGSGQNHLRLFVR